MIAESEPISLMTYSHDAYGLGHLMRNSNIAARFVREVPDATVLMITGCLSAPPFLVPQGVDFIKVPSVVKVNANTFAPLSLRVGSQKAKSIRSAIIESAVTQFQPRLFLVDHVPAGIHGELLPTLRMLKNRDDPPRIVLGLRDIIDDPEVVKGIWRADRVYETIREYYDEVFIYGCRDLYDSAAHYGLNKEFSGPVRYCGYVGTEKPVQSREQIRTEWRIQKEKLVVVTAGGGRDGYPLIQSCLDAFRHIGGELPFEVVIITGPLMEPQQREDLRQQGRQLGAHVFIQVEDPPSFINAADLVITMAGYNSLCEVVSLRRKALVVPRLAPGAAQRADGRFLQEHLQGVAHLNLCAEQPMRAKIFQERGLIDVLEPPDVSPRNLAERILADLQRPDLPMPSAVIDTSGTQNAAFRLAALAWESAEAPVSNLKFHHAAGALRKAPEPVTVSRMALSQ